MSEKTFDVQYGRLNKAQKQAVDTIDGPVMVIAGPGTGKTTILTLRIANILRSTDTPAHGILAITYTDAGVKAMRSKLHDIIGSRAHDVAIHTFHSFASSIIAEYHNHFIQISDRKVMTDIEQETIIRNIIADNKFSDIRPIAKPDHYVSDIIKSIEESKRQAMTPEMLRQYTQAEIIRIKDNPESISTRGATKGQLKADARESIIKHEKTLLFADVYDQYEASKSDAKKLDFSDLIIELLVTLREDELLLRLIQERFLYILVDEHQDTNDAQNFIISLIAEFFETPNIFIVGDEKQAIYRFQGASVENFLLLQKRWPAMKLISLDTNYRSHQSILDASFGMIENNYRDNEHIDLRIKLKSGRGAQTVETKQKASAENVEVVVGANMSAIENHLVTELKNITRIHPESTVAVITRRNRDLDRVIRLCEENGIKITSERSVDIFNHPVGSLFFDLIEYLVDPSRIDSLSKTIISGMWNISFDEAIEVIKNLKSGNVGTNIFENKLSGLLHIQRQILNDSPVNFLIHSAEESGYMSLVLRDPSYTVVWRGIVALAESIVRDSNISEPFKLLDAMLAYRLSAESRMVKVTVGAPSALFHALTAHGSKGLEFDYVFIPYATDESWIGKNRGSSFVLPRKESSRSDVNDIRRLFYVALTRARERVTVLTAHEESDGRRLTPLRFIAELDENHVKQVDLIRSNSLIKSSSEHLKRSTTGEKIIDLAKRTIMDKGISVTALNHYLRCPNEFIYQSILRLPQSLSVSAEKGTAMHEAISAIWKSGHVDVTSIGSIMKSTIHDYFETSFLSISDKSLIKNQLSADIPVIAKALADHFALKQKSDIVFVEHWVQTVHSVMHNNKSVEVSIHGKLDAIVDKNYEILVFDYKTRQALSVNAIRGETKNSNGDYFRQLIFYKMLLNGTQKWRSKKIIPALVFVSPDDKDRCPTVMLPITVDDTDRVGKEIQSLIDSVWSGEIVGKKCGDDRCHWCGLSQL